MTQKILIICNGAPYGDERLYNGLRLTIALAKRQDVELKLFLIGDAASGAKAGQIVPNGYYNVERMLQVIVRNGGEVGVCGTCLDARGLSEGPFPEGVSRSGLDEFAEWTLWADKVLVF